MENLSNWASDVPDYALKLANKFWPGPMTLILPRTFLAKDFITGRQNSVGIRIPSHHIALKLLKEFESLGGLGVAAPSANRFGKVSPTSAHDVIDELGDFLDSKDKIIDGGPSQVGIESTIIDCMDYRPRIIRPGAVTIEMVEHLLSLKIKSTEKSINKIKSPGILDSHYAPNAKVHKSGSPNIGDGFIALSSVLTPYGAIRLASPKNNLEYAQIIFSAFRLADIKGIKDIYVVPPSGNDIAIAINDRITKAANK
jgi:L-threonylcarbamoyladenylate synthase